jgi:hypothetical protein
MPCAISRFAVTASKFDPRVMVRRQRDHDQVSKTTDAVGLYCLTNIPAKHYQFHWSET